MPPSGGGISRVHRTTLAGGGRVLGVRPGAGWAPVGAAWSKRGDTRTNLPCGQSCCNSGAQNVLELKEGHFGQCLQMGEERKEASGRTEASGECEGHASEPLRVRQGRGQSTGREGRHRAGRRDLGSSRSFVILCKPLPSLAGPSHLPYKERAAQAAPLNPCSCQTVAVSS